MSTNAAKFEICREYGSYESVLIDGAGIARFAGKMVPVERRGTMLHPISVTSEQVAACQHLLDLQMAIERSQYDCDHACDRAELEAAESARDVAIAARDVFVASIGATIEWI